MSTLRTFFAPKAIAGPPAIWTSFARMSAFKSWVIVALLFVVGLQLLAIIRLGSREPDVVLIGADGKSTFVDRAVASGELVRFIAHQKGRPSALTVVHFTKEFLGLSLGVNSSTYEATWPQALGMMAPALRGKLEKEAAEQRLVETYKLARMKTELNYEDIRLLGEVDGAFEVRAIVGRSKSGLLDGAGLTRDRLEVDMVLRVVPRTAARPDGLEVADWRLRVLTEADKQPTSKESARVP